MYTVCVLPTFLFAAPAKKLGRLQVNSSLSLKHKLCLKFKNQYMPVVVYCCLSLLPDLVIRPPRIAELASLHKAQVFQMKEVQE